MEKQRWFMIAACVGALGGGAAGATGALGDLTVSSSAPQPTLSQGTADQQPSGSVPASSLQGGSAEAVQSATGGVQPATPVQSTPAATAPTEAVQDAAPAEAIQQTAPTEAVQDAAPAEAIQQTAPTEAVQDAAPAEAIQQTAPTEAVQDAAPAEAIQQTAPTEAVQDAAPADTIVEQTSSAGAVIPVSGSAPGAAANALHSAGTASSAVEGSEQGAKGFARDRGQMLRNGETFADRSRAGSELGSAGRFAQTLKPAARAAAPAGFVLDVVEQHAKGSSNEDAIGHAAASTAGGSAGLWIGGTLCAPLAPVTAGAALAACAGAGSVVGGWAGGKLYNYAREHRASKPACSPDGPCERRGHGLLFFPLLDL